MRVFKGAIALLVTIGAVGCQPDSDLDVIPAKEKVEFVGEPDSQFAATWKTSDGVSTYVFEPSGKYTLHSKIRVPGGNPMESNMAGEWRRSGERLLFKDANGAVVPYAFKLSGDTLELSLTGQMKKTTVLKRQ